MFYEIYITASVVIAAFAVYDFSDSEDRTKPLYLFGILVLYAITWPIVIINTIRKAWKNRLK
jgi:hypothetical protein